MFLLIYGAISGIIVNVMNGIGRYRNSSVQWKFICKGSVFKVEESVLLAASEEFKEALRKRLGETGVRIIECECTYSAIYKAVALADPVIAVLDNKMFAERLRTDIKKLGSETKTMLIETGHTKYSAACVEIMKQLEGLAARQKLCIAEIDDHCEQAIMIALDEMRITPNYLGYNYIKDILMMILTGRKGFDTLSKSVYPAIAEKYGVSAASVEHSIRTAVKNAWNKGDKRLFSRYLGVSITNSEHVPSNRVFLFTVANTIELDLSKFKKALRKSFIEKNSC